MMRVYSGQFDKDAQAQLTRLMVAGVDADDLVEAFLLGYLVRQDKQQAADVLDAWDKLHPNSVDVKFYRGVVSRLRGDIDQARAAFQSALVDCPHHELARESLAELLLELRLPRDALRHYLLAIRENPGSIPARVGAARSLRRLGKWTAAKDLLKGLIDRPKPVPEVVQEAGQIALETGGYEFAQSRLTEAASRDGRLAAATALALQGHHDEGKALLQQQARLESLNKHRRDLQVTTTLEPANTSARRELESVASELRRAGR